MAGVTVSFVADPALAARVKDIARSDGVTPSQAAAHASALGALIPASARRTLRFVLSEGGEEAQQQLAMLLSKAIAQVGNMVLERQLLARAQSLGLGLAGKARKSWRRKLFGRLRIMSVSGRPKSGAALGRRGSARHA